MGEFVTKNKSIKIVVLFIILAIVIYLSFKLRNDERDDILNNSIVVIGTVTNVGWKTIDVSYEINGKVYVYTENIPFKSVVVGEQFYTLVNNKKLERALVYDNKPIFDTTKYSFSIVSPNSVSEPITDNDYLCYEYTVNGRKYSRIQKYYGDVFIPKNFKKLKVKYRIDRPEIGYLVEK